MGGGMGGKGHGQNKPPKDGVGKVCPVCGSYNKKDATLCGDNKPNAGCGAALPATLTRFPSYAPGKGQPTVAPTNNAPTFTTKNSPIHPYGGRIDVKASLNGTTLPAPNNMSENPQLDSVALLKQKIKKKDDINMTWAGLAPD